MAMTFKITAQMLEQWSELTKSRELLPVLLRRLIHETLPKSTITTIDFPGHENVQRPGFDGILTTITNHQYIPKGTSVWECGTSVDPTAKANNDFNKRASDADGDTVFIFATSRNWSQKEKWRMAKSGTPWKEVRAYDANDLEQWLEHSPYTSLWLAEQMEMPQNHLETPEKFLGKWLHETEPEFPVDILFSNRNAPKDELQAFLKKAQAGTDFSIAADTREEAIAFVGAVIRKANLCDYPSMIINNSQGITEAIKWSSTYGIASILIAKSKEVAKDIPIDLSEKNMLIVIHVREDSQRRSASHNKEYRSKIVTLPRVKDFSVIYKQDHPTARNWYKRAGGSLSVLHRMCNKNTAKREPTWANLTAQDRKFIWLTLIGRWDEQYEGDKESIKTISGLNTYEDWRNFVQDIIGVECSPLEHTSGDNRGYRLFSRLDAFHSIANKINGDDIEQFLNLAKRILSEEDPNYRPPSDTAEIHIHQRRHYSDVMRSGITEGLIILNTTKDMLECNDITNKISSFYDHIFEPEKAWYSLYDVMPQLAEASPYDFISKLDETLDNNPERIEDLFTPRGGYIHNDYKHPALMWALELLAWNTENLERVLMRLCLLQNKYEGNIKNYGNKPSESMHNILRSWMPQTAASTEQRKVVLDNLYQKYPVESTKLALALADNRDSIGDYSYTPTWSDDALNIQQVTMGDVYEIKTKAIEIIINFLKDEDQAIEERYEVAEKAIYNLGHGHWDDRHSEEATEAICSLPNNHPTLSEKIHKHVRKLKIRNINMRTQGSKEAETAIELFKKLQDYFQSKDSIKDQAYMFSIWPEMEEFIEAELSHKEQEKLIRDKQSQILDETYRAHGIAGVINLVKLAPDPDIISRILYINYIAKSRDFSLEKYMVHLLKSDIDAGRIRSHLIDIFGWTKDYPEVPDAMNVEIVIGIIEDVIARIEEDNKVDNWEEKKIFLLHAIRIDDEKGRNYIDNLPDEVQKHYFSYYRINRPVECWVNEVLDTNSVPEYPLENEWLANKYLEYKRPRLGWYSFRIDKFIPFEQKLELLDAMFIKTKDEGGDKDPVPQGYYIQNFINDAIKRQGLDITKLADIEFKFYRHLDTVGKDRVSFIQRRIGEQPKFFIDLHIYLYMTDDGKSTPPTEPVNKEQANIYASISFEILHKINLRSANHQWSLEGGKLDGNLLQKWINKSRELAQKAKRGKFVDASIGRGLAHSFNGVRPEPAVCNILEHIQSDTMASSFRTGRYNSRSMLTNGVDEKGYTSERLAQEYQEAATQMRDDGYPFVSKIMQLLAQTYRDNAQQYKDEKERRDLDWR